MDTSSSGIIIATSADGPFFEGGEGKVGGEATLQYLYSAREMAANAAVMRKTQEERVIEENCGCSSSKRRGGGGGGGVVVHAKPGGGSDDVIDVLARQSSRDMSIVEVEG